MKKQRASMKKQLSRGQSGVDYLLLVMGALLIVVIVLLILRQELTAPTNQRIMGDFNRSTAGNCSEQARLRGEALGGCVCSFNNECASGACSSGACS